MHAEEGPSSIKQIEKDLKDNSRSEGESNMGPFGEAFATTVYWQL